MTLPPPGFGQRPLILAPPPSGVDWLRLYQRRHGDPLGFGKTPSRFSDPRSLPPPDRYGVVYLGSTLKVCVLEAIVRDRADGQLSDLVISPTELTDAQTAWIEGPNLRLVDLRGDGRIRLGVPTDALHAFDQTLGQAWGLAFWEHDAAPDGLIYPSRLNGDTNIAVFDRAIPKLSPTKIAPLMDHGADLAAVIRDLALTLS